MQSRISDPELQERPFILTRSAFYGSQQFAAKWTGDNFANENDLQIAVSQLLQLSISGLSFVGADIPGFSGHASDELYVMFYQLGTFFPFMRAHGHIDALNREPYLQKPEVQQDVKEALYLRYDLAHYMYTMHQLASTEGTPILRPMWMEFPQANFHDVETQFIFGDSLLVVPKLKGGSQRNLEKFKIEQLDGRNFIINYHKIPKLLQFQVRFSMIFNILTSSEISQLKSLSLIQKIHIINQLLIPSKQSFLSLPIGMIILPMTSSQEDNIFQNISHYKTAVVSSSKQALSYLFYSILKTRVFRQTSEQYQLQFPCLMRIKDNPIRLDIFPNLNGSANGQLYVDDGLKIRPKGSIFVFEYHSDENGSNLTVRCEICEKKGHQVEIQSVRIYGDSKGKIVRAQDHLGNKIITKQENGYIELTQMEFELKTIRSDREIIARVQFDEV